MLRYFSLISLVIFGVYSTETETEDVTQCDDDWLYYDEYCYWSSSQILAKNKSASPVANWFGAQLYCQELGANLVQFKDTFEMGLISSLVACSSSWLGLVYKITPTEKNWVWWSTCDDASHLINKSEAVCGPHYPTTAKLDPKGIVIAEFPDVKLPFVCKRPANEVKYNCESTTEMSTESNTMSTTPMGKTQQPTTTILLRDEAADASGNSMEPEASSTMKEDRSTEEVQTTPMTMMTTHTSEPDTTTMEPATTTPTITMTTARTTKSMCATKCSTGFLDDDAPCCPNSLNKWATKRFYDAATSKCYYLPVGFNVPVDYFAAQLACQEKSTHLSSIHSAAENHIVGFLSMCQMTWIGLENVRPKEVCNCHGWAWEDYSSGGKNHTICDDYAHNFFDAKLTPKAPVCSQESQCATIYQQMVQQHNEFYWKNNYCYELHNFMCVE